MKTQSKSIIIFIMMLIISYSPVSHALTMVPVPTEPIYFEPPVVLATDEQQKWNCTALDNAIRYLHPCKYSYKPGFYEDNANKVAVGLMAVNTLPIIDGGLVGLSYLAYSSLLQEKEQRRVLLIEQKIAMFQRLKAEKHCYE